MEFEVKRGARKTPVPVESAALMSTKGGLCSTQATF